MVEYVFEPFETVFLRRRDEILKLVSITAQALHGTSGLEELSKVLKKPDEQVSSARELERAALDELKADLPLLHSAASVLIWGALEAAFRDFIVRWLTHYPCARTVPEFKNVRIRLIDYEMLDGEDRMRYLLGILEQEFAASLKPGAGRFFCLLKPLGIIPDISADDHRILNELAAVRNVIVHKAGIADARILKLCPWLGVSLGDNVTIGHEAFIKYVTVASHFAASVIEAAQKVPAISTPNPE